MGDSNCDQGLKIAIADLPNAFLNAFNNEQTLMLLKGKLAELMVHIDPNSIGNL